MSLRIKNILTNRVSKLTLFIFFVLIVSAFFRFYRLEDFATFLGDQGRDAIVMKRIVTLEHFPAIGAPSSLGQIYLGPFYYYLVSPFLLLFNFNPAGPIFAVALLSFLGILAAFVAIKKEVNNLTAIIFFLFTLFSFVNIQSSRFSWNPNLLPIFSFFTLYFFYKLLTAKRALYAILFGSFLSFSIQLHHLAVSLLIPIFFFGMLFFLKRDKNILVSKFPNFLISIFTFFFFSLPLIIFDLRHDFLNTRNLLKLITQGNPIDHENFLQRFLEVNQTFYRYIFQLEVNQFIAFAGTVLFVFFFFSKHSAKKFDTVTIHFLNVISFLLFFSVLNTSRNAHYYNSIYLSFFLVLSAFFTRLGKDTFVKYLFIFMFVAGYIFLNIAPLNYLFTKTKGQIAIAETITDSIRAAKPASPYQTVALPDAETDGHIRYFLEIKGFRPLAADTLIEPKELYVLCFDKDCDVLGSGQWQIASFKNKRIVKIWTVEGVKIYKLIHAK